MKWFYRCPLCNSWVSVEWAEKDNRFQCPKCNKAHYPPTPSEQFDAYVDDRTPPEEMALEVYRMKGTVCTVPGCSKEAETLDHRISWERSKKGTSVNNLYPMCTEHNASKGNREYLDWLKEELLGSKK